MKEEEKLKGWLAKSLPESELEAFEKSDAFGAFLKISETARQFKAPKYETEASFSEILGKLPSQKTIPFPLFRVIRNIAAILILGIGMFFFFENHTSDIATSTKDNQEHIFLPDSSKVIVNANSTVSYNKDTWSDNRDVSLKGEAFFKVAKGEKFNVKTAQGIVTVLGTEFTVKDTKNSFEVICYEGMVSVLFKGNTYKLLGGNGVKFSNGNIEKVTTSTSKPGWLDNTSIFKSTPLSEVLTTLEKIYTIKVTHVDIDTSILYTGSFTHTNLNEALQSITVPLGLSFEVEGTTVNLKN